MSLFLETREESYRAQRAVSQGAGITLVVGAGEYTASFDCARRIARVIGDREMREEGDGIFESIPAFRIPTKEIYSVLQKLSAKHSIALVELVCDSKNTCFVLVWKIAASNLPTSDAAQVTTSPTAEIDLDLDQF